MKGSGVKKVVIDAGHGGHDPGCHGTKSKEKDVCLNIALNLGQLINKHFKDVEVIYTRDKDVFVELHERAQIANKNEADLFICIHANSGKKEAFGAETYVMGLHKSEANLQVAKRENAVILMEDNYKAVYEGFDPNSDEDIIALTLMQSTFLEQSVQFANKVQKKLVDLGRKSRGVKQAGFLVLYKTAMPSVLIETGFLTNGDEEKFLSDTKNQEKMAEAFFKAFKEYKEQIEKGNNIAIEEETKKDTSSVKKQVKEVKVEKIEEKPVIVKKVENIQEAISYQLNDSAKKGILKADTLTVLYKDTTVKVIEKKEEPQIAEKAIEPQKEEIPIKKENSAEKIVFRVQIKASPKQISITSENFNGLSNVYEYKDNGMYKYAVGESDNLNELLYLQNNLRQKGFKDAFIIAFKNNVRIPTQEAVKLVKTKI